MYVNMLTVSMVWSLTWPVKHRPRRWR